MFFYNHIHGNGSFSRPYILVFAFFLLHARYAEAQPTTLYLTDAPVWLHYFCDGSEPDPNGSTSVQGMHCYQNLTVPSGATLTVTAKNSTSGTPQNVPIGALMAFVSGACSIAGTINAAAIITSNGNGGGAGGGGGGGSTIAGSNGADSDVFGSASVTRVAAGAFGGAIGQSGGNGTSPQPSSQKAIWSKALTLGSLGGSFGGKGGGNSSTNGGGGGGGVMLVCGSISFTGSINASGANGFAGSGGIGGGGGGGGGVVLLASPNYLADSRAIVVSGGVGGLGGSGAGNGGNGGNGWFKEFSLQ